MKSIILLFLFLATHVTAQEEKGGIRVRFLAQLPPVDHEKVVMTAENVSSESFSLPLYNLSRSQKAPARQFVLRTAGESKPLVKVVLPESGSEFVVVLVVNAAGSYQDIVLPADDTSFRPGDVYAFNSSKQVVMGQVGTFRFSIAPAKGIMIKPSGAFAEGYFNVVLATGKEGENKPRILSMSRWPVTKHRRSYLFFFDDTKLDRVSYRAVDEYIKPASEM